MEETFHFAPHNVCSREMLISHDGDTITGLQVIGGCRGNLTGISKLVVGMKIDDVIAKLEGIQCPGSRTRMTSCPDQLAQGLKALKAELKK
jgi:uncharacterized protein (TIGR03905 family)